MLMCMENESLWSVKPQGLYWAVKRGNQYSIGAPLFETKLRAIEFACICAKSNQPASVEVLDALGDVEERIEYPQRSA
jgi:hypothetical protein